jgi:hypothetical protein
VAPVRALPRDERELFIAAGNGHVLAFDNLTILHPDWNRPFNRADDADDGDGGDAKWPTTTQERAFRHLNNRKHPSLAGAFEIEEGPDRPGLQSCRSD